MGTGALLGYQFTCVRLCDGVDGQHVTQVCEALVQRLRVVALRLHWHHGLQAVLDPGGKGTLLAKHLETDLALAKVDWSIARVFHLLHLFSFSLFNVLACSFLGVVLAKQLSLQ